MIAPVLLGETTYDAIVVVPFVLASVAQFASPTESRFTNFAFVFLYAVSMFFFGLEDKSIAKVLMYLAIGVVGVAAVGSLLIGRWAQLVILSIVISLYSLAATNNLDDTGMKYWLAGSVISSFVWFVSSRLTSGSFNGEIYEPGDNTKEKLQELTKEKLQEQFNATLRLGEEVKQMTEKLDKARIKLEIMSARKNMDERMQSQLTQAFFELKEFEKYRDDMRKRFIEQLKEQKEQRKKEIMNQIKSSPRQPRLEPA